MLPGNHDITLSWHKVAEAGISLIISPLIGFVMAMFFMQMFYKTVTNKAIFKEATAKKSPPPWIRSLLILSSTFVSFSHGSNDGQKGVGLMMIILIAIVPVKFSLNMAQDPARLRHNVDNLMRLTSGIDTAKLNPVEMESYRRIRINLDSLNQRMVGVSSFNQLGTSGLMNTRKEILIFSRQSGLLRTLLGESNRKVVTKKWISDFSEQTKEIRTFTEYSPWWVIFMISIALGLGTMIGWKRIVVTLGEKIGKTHLNYAQGTIANLIAAGTISASSSFGLPVSTTHVLSSGIAGSMVSGNGMKNLQSKTIISIAVAWIITIPATVLIAGLLFLLFRVIFG
jgi:PiT family inorganic phosphate transporter